MNISLETERLLGILKDFYTLSHVRTVIYDSDFKRVAAYPEHSSDFCALLKQNPDFKSKCRQNEKDACKICNEKNSLYIYKCHAGLIEAVSPIKMNDMILGYIMFGQVIHKNSDTNEILSYSLPYADDSDALNKAFSKLKVRGDKQINAISTIMQASASYLWISNLIKVESGNHIYLLTDYINENITGDLSVDNLCSLLNVSRIKLYEISNKYYGMPISKYIRKKRVSLAKKMLENGVSVQDAAKSVGIFDSNYFSKVFKKETGLMPTEYKKKYLLSKKEA